MKGCRGALTGQKKAAVTPEKYSCIRNKIVPSKVDFSDIVYTTEK